MHLIKLKNYFDVAIESLELTQDIMSNQANNRKREPDFGVGDKVFIFKKSWSPIDHSSVYLDFSLTRKSHKITQMKIYSY